MSSAPPSRSRRAALRFSGDQGRIAAEAAPTGGYAAGVLLAAFLALLVAWPSAYAVLPPVALVLAAGAIFLGREAPPMRYPWLWPLALTIFSLVWLADVARTGHWPRAIEGSGLWLPLWPLLAAVVYLGWRRLAPPLAAWWWGLGLGAVLAGGIAAWEVWVQGMGRASNGINAIPFGMLSLLLGTLSLVGVLAVRSPWGKAALALATVAGLAAALLSGTRGSWIVFPALAGVLAIGFWGTLPRRFLLVLGVALLGLLLAASLSTTTSVTERMGDVVESVDNYDEGDRGNSFGVRMEMWRVGIELFLEKPLIGWGEGRLEARRDQWAEVWDLHPAVSRHDQLHHDVIDTAARRGLVGLISLLLLYGMPLWLFAGHLRRATTLQERGLAVCGLVVVVAFIGFGLTQSILRDARGLAGYLGMITISWCVVVGRRQGES